MHKLIFGLIYYCSIHPKINLCILLVLSFLHHWKCMVQKTKRLQHC